MGSSMSMFEMLVPSGTLVWLDALAWMAAVLALVTSGVVARRASRQRHRLEGMRRDLQAFAEASTRVADTLDHLLRGHVEPGEGGMTSRRYLLLQAREGMEKGEAVDSLASRLELCDDERRLLEFLARGQSRDMRPHPQPGPRAPGREAWVA